MLSHASLERQITGILAVWGIAGEAQLTPVSGGTLNWNFEVRAASRRYFLRCYRSNLETERIEGEHRLLEWAAARGIPLAPTIPLPGGRTLHLAGEHRWALFPWLEGATVERGQLSRAQARALGEAHGRVHSVLSAHPDSGSATFTMRWDKQQSMEALQHLLSVGAERGSEGWILEGIARQLRQLEAAEVSPPEHFAALPCQLLHGDFHDQQVLFKGDRVTAVVDWEIWHTDPRSWELVRSLAFSRLLDSPLLEDYLAGYREHVQPSEEELQLALTLWFQSRPVGLWVWWAYLKDANERVKEFFPSMLAELDLVTDDRWTTSIRDRVRRFNAT
ncbi:MAG: phosphotransferase [Tepidiformaceae bacterium]